MHANAKTEELKGAHKDETLSGTLQIKIDNITHLYLPYFTNFIL